MKRIFLLFTIFILLFTQLTACSKKIGTDLWVNGKKLDRVTLTICLPPNPGVYPSKYTGTLLKEVLKELGKKAEQELNVKINIANLKLKSIDGQGATGEITTNFQEVMNGNDPCDMFFLNSNSRRFSTTEFSLPALYDAGLLKDITNLFPENAPIYFKLFSKEELDTVSNDGKILALPSYKLPDTKRVHAIVRKSLLKKYKIKNISSYEEYESFLETIRKNEPEMVPTDILSTTLEMFAEANGYIVAANTSNYVNKQIGLELVYRSDDPAMKLMDWEQTPEYRNTLEILRRWKTKGYYNMQYKASLNFENYGSVMGYKGWADGLSESFKTNNGISIKFVEFELYPTMLSQRTFDPGNIMIFNAKSKNTERALAFIDWLMNDKEANNLFEYGIEDKDFKLDKKGQVKLLIPEGYEEYDVYNNLHKVWSLENDNLGIQDTAFLKEQAKYIKSRSKYFPHTGFMPDTAQLSQGLDYKARYEFEQKVLNGELTPVEIDDFLKEQKKITDPLVAVIQAQLDEWKNKGKR